MLEMNIIQLFETFETNLQAVEYLERARWDDKPSCHYCESKRTSIHKSKDRAIRRWQCHECHRAFSVTVGTVFHRTHVPLKKWFLILALMLNAKKSTSSCQIARDLGMNQPTVWSIMHRIRAAMALDPEQEALFKGIVEADETYIGGKPRKENRTKDRTPRKRGLGTDKTPVLGVLERGGRVRTEVMDKVTCENLEWFLDRFVEKDRTILITDENPVYRRIGRKIAHAIINHSLAYVEQADAHQRHRKLLGPGKARLDRPASPLQRQIHAALPGGGRLQIQPPSPQACLCGLARRQGRLRGLNRNLCKLMKNPPGASAAFSP